MEQVHRPPCYNNHLHFLTWSYISRYLGTTHLQYLPTSTDAISPPQGRRLSSTMLSKHVPMRMEYEHNPALLRFMTLSAIKCLKRFSALCCAKPALLLSNKQCAKNEPFTNVSDASTMHFVAEHTILTFLCHASIAHSHIKARHTETHTWSMPCSHLDWSCTGSRAQGTRTTYEEPSTDTYAMDARRLPNISHRS